jgi:hypothetical protein
MKTAVVLSLLVLGLILFCTGALWPKIFPATTTWTDEKANRTAEVNERIAALNYVQSQPISMHAGEDRGLVQRELIDLMREKDQLNSEFHDAVARPHTASLVFRISGLFIAAVGVCAWGLMRLHEFRNQPPNRGQTF